MHDTMGDVARIKASIALLKSGTLNNDEQVKFLDAIETSNEHLKLVLDNYYIENNILHTKPTQ